MYKIQNNDTEEDSHEILLETNDPREFLETLVNLANKMSRTELIVTFDGHAFIVDLWITPVKIYGG